MCKNPSSGQKEVQYYTNSGYKTNLYSLNPTLGITFSNLTTSENNLICSFVIQNSIFIEKYYDFNADSPFLIAAYGQISNGKKMILFSVLNS
jgi:hypothetical protein